MTLGERIQKLRKENKWSQDTFGIKINIHGKTIARYENDSTIPSALVVKKMAEVFGVTTDYLIFGEAEDEVLTKIQDRDLLKRFEKIDKMETENKNILLRIIDLFIRDSVSQKIYSELPKTAS